MLSTTPHFFTPLLKRYIDLKVASGENEMPSIFSQRHLLHDSLLLIWLLLLCMACMNLLSCSKIAFFLPFSPHRRLASEETEDMASEEEVFDPHRTPLQHPIDKVLPIWPRCSQRPPQIWTLTLAALSTMTLLPRWISVMNLESRLCMIVTKTRPCSLPGQTPGLSESSPSSPMFEKHWYKCDYSFLLRLIIKKESDSQVLPQKNKKMCVQCCAT